MPNASEKVFGELDRYEVSYWPGNDSSRITVVKIPPTPPEIMLTGLLPETRYALQLQAFVENSSDGMRGMPSPKSKVMKFQTRLWGRSISFVPFFILRVIGLLQQCRVLLKGTDALGFRQTSIDMNP